MLFNSPLFVFGFLPVVFGGYLAILRAGGPKPRPAVLAWLILASLVFYGYWKPSGLLLLGASILVNGLLGRKILGTRAAASRRRWLAGGVTFNLAVLGYFKYAGFLVTNLNALAGTGLAVPHITLPLAISFFTFQKIAFLVDCHRGKVRRWDWRSFVLFATFFPQLIAGPIVHYREMEPQFAGKGFLGVRWEGVARGLTLFWIGLFKKWVLADSFAALVEQGMREAAWRADLPFLESWRVALGYALQIYFDFAGYSSMAIGLAMMFGIRLPLNFDAPYRSTSLIEFWRRWHITLSGFLRDYLYIPLGGNRRGPARRYLNLMLTMLLGGLWHGAGWGFVLWGAMHGAALSLNHAWRQWWGKAHEEIAASLRYRAAAWAATFGFVVFAWVPFRAESLGAALNLWRGMLGLNEGWAEMIYFPDAWSGLARVLHKTGWSFVAENWSGVNAAVEFGWIAALLAAAALGPTAERWAERFKPRAAVGVGLGILVFWFVQSAFRGAASEFIYFQF